MSATTRTTNALSAAERDYEQMLHDLDLEIMVRESQARSARDRRDAHIKNKQSFITYRKALRAA